MTEQQRRRRIDRVTSESFLDDLPSRSPQEVRAMRDECREEEGRLSYVRRLVQGRIDIVRAEIGRRERGDEQPLDLVALLPRILADEPSGGGARRDARNLALYSPEGPAGSRPLDALLDEPALSRLPDLSDEELDALLARLQGQERDASSLRRTVLDHFDRLQVELVRRYREGDAAVDDVVRTS